MEDFYRLFQLSSIAAIIDEKIFTMHGGLSPDLNSMEQIRRVMRPTDIPDVGLLCDLLWSDPDKDITGWSEMTVVCRLLLDLMLCLDFTKT